MKAKSLRNTATYQKLWGGAVADPGEGPPYFSTKMRPQGPKKNFLQIGPPSLMSGSGWPPPLLSEGDLDPPLRGSMHLPSSCTMVGDMILRVRPSGSSLKLWQGSGWFCMRLHFFIKASFIIDTKGLYCVTKGNISFSSLLFCFRSAAFLLWVLRLIAICLSKLCD